MFLLESLTPPNHKVHLIDGNAKPLGEAELRDFIRTNEIKLVGIGAMTRMAAKAYRMADAARAAGALVVMGGPHVTEVPDEPLGRDGGPRHVDAVALGEADATWPIIVNDAANGSLREVYAPIDESGNQIKPSLSDYPIIRWDKIDLTQFNLMAKLPSWARFVLSKAGLTWNSLYIVPIESGRGCPYGCDFCTVTGFFGDSIRFRSNESVIDELLMIKSRVKKEQGEVGVFFIDDNFAINVRRTKQLLREMIRRDATVPWVGQISINLLRDEELLDLIGASGGRWIFIGLESIDAGNLKEVSKGFNKPAEYASTLQKLADRGIYAITSFIFGMDGDEPGVAKRTAEAIESWPPGLPVFGLLTPYPATPLYDRLGQESRLTRPKHWLDFRPFRMAFTPRRISIEQAEAEVHEAWTRAYDASAFATALERMERRPLGEKSILLIAKLLFRGIYFPQMKRSDWARVVFSYRSSIFKVLCETIAVHRRKSRERMCHE
jgi:radical SAM superfamily enzyme YgiQ (UPF0313 family)